MVKYRDMVTVIRDNIQRLVDKGHDGGAGEGGQSDGGLQGRGTGRESGPWTTDMFVEAI